MTTATTQAGAGAAAVKRPSDPRGRRLRAALKQTLVDTVEDEASPDSIEALHQARQETVVQRIDQYGHDSVRAQHLRTDPHR